MKMLCFCTPEEIAHVCPSDMSDSDHNEWVWRSCKNKCDAEKVCAHWEHDNTVGSRGT